MGQVRGLHIVVPGSVQEMFVLWMSLKGNNKFNQKVLKSVFFAVVWSLWKVRNDLIFGTQAFNLEQILLLIKFRVGCWINLWEDNFLYNPAELSIVSITFYVGFLTFRFLDVLLRHDLWLS